MQIKSTKTKTNKQNAIEITITRKWSHYYFDRLLVRWSFSLNAVVVIVVGYSLNELCNKQALFTFNGLQDFPSRLDLTT